MGTWLKGILYKTLSFESYLSVISKLYFISYSMGLLKTHPLYEYHHFLREFVQKDDICIDIGANLGYISKILAKLVGKNGQVHSVEPVAPILSTLKKNLKGCHNITLYPYALGAAARPIKLGNDSLKKQAHVATGSHYIIEADPEVQDADALEFNAIMRRGSELFSDLARCDFIKCDIEGYELVVLREMKPIIERFRPIMLVETRDEQRTGLLEMLGSLGYSAYILDNQRLRVNRKDDTKDILFITADHQPQFSRFIG